VPAVTVTSSGVPPAGTVPTTVTVGGVNGAPSPVVCNPPENSTTGSSATSTASRKLPEPMEPLPVDIAANPILWIAVVPVQVNVPL
jgi:hypothetical protein